MGRHMKHFLEQRACPVVCDTAVASSDFYAAPRCRKSIPLVYGLAKVAVSNFHAAPPCRKSSFTPLSISELLRHHGAASKSESATCSHFGCSDTAGRRLFFLLRWRYLRYFLVPGHLFNSFKSLLDDSAVVVSQIVTLSRNLQRVGCGI